MVDYFWKLTTLWNELANYKELPDCYCGGQTCTWIIDAECNKKKKGYHKFPIGLDNSLCAVVSQILNMNPFPPLIMHTL